MLAAPATAPMLGQGAQYGLGVIIRQTPLGTAFGHLAIGVPDIYGTCERLAKDGVKIPRPPGPMKHGGSVIAFVEDPDGYKIELIEKKPD